MNMKRSTIFFTLFTYFFIMLKLSYKFEKCLSILFVCLSDCPSVPALTRINSSLELIYVIVYYYDVFGIENERYSIYGLFTDTLKRILLHCCV